MELISATPGAFVFVTYDGDWPGDPVWPESRESIICTVNRYPVIGFYGEPTIKEREMDDGFPDVRPMYLEKGLIVMGERTPNDWEEEIDVALGVYPAEIDDQDIMTLAINRCWVRCSHQKAKEARAAKG